MQRGRERSSRNLVLPLSTPSVPIPSTTTLLFNFQSFQSLLEYCVAQSLITITEEEIQALTSTDVIGKLVAIVQTVDFIASCIARGVKGLAITELEFLTLGFAALNLVSYSFWWSKPSRIQSPVHVTDTIMRRPVPKPAQEEKSNCSLITRPFFTCKAWISKISSVFGSRIRQDYYDDASPSPTPLPLCLYLMLPVLAVTRLFSYALSADAAEPGQPENGNIFSASTFEETRSPLTYALTYTAAVVLGVFHCIPIILNYHDFPGHNTEHILWTVFALMATILPLLTIILSPLIFVLLLFWACRNEDSRWDRAQLFMIILLSLAYIVARIALMVLAAKQLTDLPPSALQKVEWANLIPHFGI